MSCPSALRRAACSLLTYVSFWHHHATMMKYANNPKGLFSGTGTAASSPYAAPPHDETRFSPCKTLRPDAPNPAYGDSAKASIPPFRRQTGGERAARTGKGRKPARFGVFESNTAYFVDIPLTGLASRIIILLSECLNFDRQIYWRRHTHRHTFGRPVWQPAVCMRRNPQSIHDNRCIRKPDWPDNRHNDSGPGAIGEVRGGMPDP